MDSYKRLQVSLAPKVYQGGGVARHTVCVKGGLETHRGTDMQAIKFISHIDIQVQMGWEGEHTVWLLRNPLYLFGEQHSWQHSLIDQKAPRAGICLNEGTASICGRAASR